MSRRERGAIAAVTAGILAVMVLWALLVPVFGAPDEHAHVNSAVRLTQEIAWPDPGDAAMYGMVAAAREEAALPAADRSTFAELDERVPGWGGVDQMTQHPPLYYAFGAAVLQSIGFMELRADIAVTALRLAGLIFALPLPLLLWNSVRRLTRSPKAAVLAAASILAVPQLAHIFAAVSNDGLTVLLCSVVIWLAIRAMTGDHRWRTVLGMGAALGLALLVKGTALPFVPFVAAVLLIWPRHSPFLARLLRAGASLLLAFAIGGWWWVRNVLRFGDIQPSGLANVRDTVPWEPGTEPNPIGFLDRLWSRASVSFWGNFGWLEFPLPQMLTDILTVAALLVVAFYAYRRGATRLPAIVLTALPVVLLLMLFLNTWRHYLRTQQFTGMQGRYFFVALVALVAVSAIAWRRFVAAEHRVRVGLALLGVFAGLAAFGLFRAYCGLYENDIYRITLEGMREWAALVAGGWLSIIAGSLLAAAAGVFAVLVAWRFIGSPPQPTDTAAEDLPALAAPTA
ncbi:ArnT family glycosyltransferase [Microbacterium sp. NPDC057407]|uniref:ArnT family glycosyltransferase n=1 Tax=Microbacterium sp. NPDC057407 TaxID=3346120 RepID=UPI00366F8023